MILGTHVHKCTYVNICMLCVYVYMSEICTFVHALHTHM